MIYTEMTIKAMQIAYKAHAGQVDYSNVPYVFHPYHLAEQMEDEIIKLLTHEKGVDYFDYVRKIKTNPVATKVKLADLAHNSDETRNTGINVPEEKRRSWAEKYAKAKDLLLQ